MFHQLASFQNKESQTHPKSSPEHTLWFERPVQWIFTALARYGPGGTMWDLSTITKFCAIKLDLYCIQLGKPNHQHNQLLGSELELRDLLLEMCAFLLGNDLVVTLYFPYERRNWSHGSSITIQNKHGLMKLAALQMQGVLDRVNFDCKFHAVLFIGLFSDSCPNGKLFIESSCCLMGCWFCRKISWGGSVGIL